MVKFLLWLSPLFILAAGDGRKKIIKSAAAPQAIGPYSQAVEVDGLLYLSGQIALTSGGAMDTSSFELECTRVLLNIDNILAAGGKARSQVCKTTVYLTDLSKYATLNRIYGEYFGTDFPAREVVEVSALPRGAHVEISLVAR